MTLTAWAVGSNPTEALREGPSTAKLGNAIVPITNMVIMPNIVDAKFMVELLLESRV